MSNIEIIYRHCLEKVAKKENAMMRKGMGYNISEDQEFSSPVMKAIEELGEGTVDDIRHKCGLSKKQTQMHLYKLKKLGLITSINTDSGRIPSIWSIKL